MLERKHTSTSSRPSLMRMSTQPVLSLQGDQIQSPANQNNNSFRSCKEIKEEHELSNVLNMPSALPDSPTAQATRPISQLARVIYIDKNHTSNQTNQNPHQVIQPSLFAFRQESLRGGSRILQIPSASELPEISRIPSIQNMPRVPSNFALPRVPSQIGIPRVPSQFAAPRIPSSQNLPNDNNILPIDDIGEVDSPAEDPEQDEPVAVIDLADRQAAAEAAAGRLNQDAEDLQVKKQAVRRVALQFALNIVILVAYILGYLYIKKDCTIDPLFGVFLAFAAIYILWTVITGGFSDGYDKGKVLLSVGNTLSLIAYIVIAFLKVKDVDIPLSPFVLPGIALIFGSCCKYSVEQPSSGTVLLIIQKVVLWAQLLLIGLNVDGVDISWIAVFIPLYFAFMVLSFSSIIIICGAIFSFFTIARHEGTSPKLVVGTIWYLLNASYTGIWLLILAVIISHLNSDTNNMTLGLKVGFGHSGFLLLFTLAFWKMLVEFQQFEIQSEMLANDRQIAEAAIEAQSRAPQIRFKVYKENKSNLVMISPTFYTIFRRNAKAKQPKHSPEEVEQLRKDIEKARLEKYRSGLMMQTAHKSADPGALARNLVSSPAKKIKNRNLDLSEGDIHMRQLPEPQAITELPQMKRGESNRSNENLCAICFDTIPNAVFMDCGHGGVCYECALENWKKTDNCLMCRKPINKVLKIVHYKPLNVIKVVESTRKVIENPS